MAVKELTVDLVVEDLMINLALHIHLVQQDRVIEVVEAIGQVMVQAVVAVVLELLDLMHLLLILGVQVVTEYNHRFQEMLPITVVVVVVVSITIVVVQ